MRSSTRIVLAVLLAFVPALRAGEPSTTNPVGYERRDIEGFTVYVGMSVLHQSDDGFQRAPLTALEGAPPDWKPFLYMKSGSKT